MDQEIATGVFWFYISVSVHSLDTSGPGLRIYRRWLRSDHDQGFGPADELAEYLYSQLPPAVRLDWELQQYQLSTEPSQKPPLPPLQARWRNPTKACWCPDCVDKDGDDDRAR